MTESLWPGAMMQTFVEQVRDAAGMSSSEEAEHLARGTLRALAEAVSWGELEELTQGLPPELRQDLSHHHHGQARPMGKEEFLDRVSADITTTDMDTAERQTRAALSVLRRWAPEGEVDDTVDQLPRDLGALFR